MGNIAEDEAVASNLSRGRFVCMYVGSFGRTLVDVALNLSVIHVST
jgi:hypothetical protein